MAPRIAPSLLSADFANLGAAAGLVHREGCEWLHFDVMDGHFVPNLTFGAMVVNAVRPHSKAIFDTHLMVREVEKFLPDFCRGASDYLTIHQESTVHIDRALNVIRAAGKKVGISLNPATPVEILEPILGLVDLVLVMSVNPGFGGQKFIPYCAEKIARLKKYREVEGHHYLISVDGGINEATMVGAVNAGADILVMGNAIFGQPDIPHTIRRLRTLLEAPLDPQPPQDH